MTDDDAPLPVPELLSFYGVNTKMTIVVSGDIVLLHTSDDEQPLGVDEMMGGYGQVPGKPMELTHQQARDLAHLILATVHPGPEAEQDNPPPAGH